MAKTQKAWSDKLWREIARGMTNPTVNTIIEECKIICRGVFPHRSGATLIFRDGHTALWKDFSNEEQLRWNRALAGWGWLNNENKPIDWTRDTENRIARLGIWVWTRDMDGPLPGVLAKGAQRRKEQLEDLQQVLNNHGVWQTNGGNGLTLKERLEQVDMLEAASGKNSDVVRQWANIENELQWKDATIPKLEKWFERHPAIPLSTRELWLSAWKKT